MDTDSHIELDIYLHVRRGRQYKADDRLIEIKILIRTLKRRRDSTHTCRYFFAERSSCL